MQKYDKFFIGGKWVEPEGNGILEVHSPASQELVGSVPESTPADMDRAVAAAREAFDVGPWPRLTPAVRGDYIAQLSAAITARMDEFATLITNENGAPITFSQMGQVFAATAVLAACVPGEPKSSSLGDHELYVAYCGRCHGEDGTGDRRSVGLNPRLDLTRSQMARSRSRQLVYQRIAFGYGPMPAFSHKLTSADMERLTKFCLELAENR